MVFLFIGGIPKVIGILTMKFQNDCLNSEILMSIKRNDTFIFLGLP